MAYLLIVGGLVLLLLAFMIFKRPASSPVDSPELDKRFPRRNRLLSLIGFVIGMFALSGCGGICRTGGAFCLNGTGAPLSAVDPPATPIDPPSNTGGGTPTQPPQSSPQTITFIEANGCQPQLAFPTIDSCSLTQPVQVGDAIQVVYWNQAPSFCLSPVTDNNQTNYKFTASAGPTDGSSSGSIFIYSGVISSAAPNLQVIVSNSTGSNQNCTVAGANQLVVIHTRGDSTLNNEVNASCVVAGSPTVGECLPIETSKLAVNSNQLVITAALADFLLGSMPQPFTQVYSGNGGEFAVGYSITTQSTDLPFEVGASGGTLQPNTGWAVMEASFF